MPSGGKSSDQPDKSRTSADDQRLVTLLTAAGKGDRAAFRSFYELTSRYAFGLALAVLRDRELAREVTQEVYVTVWRKSASYDRLKGSPMSWLGTIARNRAIDRLRVERARGFVSYSDELPDLIDDSQSAEIVTDAITVRRAIDNLRPEFRRALLLSYFSGYSNTELAEALDVPLGTAKSWVRRGLAAVREGLESAQSHLS